MSVTVAAMDEGGISRSLISAWEGPRGSLISNDEVAAFVREAPDRLVGVGSVDISRPREAVREIRRCVRELGFKAIRVLPWLWELPPTHARFYPVYSECCELGRAVLHAGRPHRAADALGGRPSRSRTSTRWRSTSRSSSSSGATSATRGPRRWSRSRPSTPTCYIDTSAYTVRRYPPQLVAYLRPHGASKVLFGTNWPMIAPPQGARGARRARAARHDARRVPRWQRGARVRVVSAAT